VFAELGVAGQPEDWLRVRGEIVAALQHIDRDLGEELGDFLAPDWDDAGGADDEAGLVGDGARREQGEDLERFTQAHLVGEQAVAGGFGEVVEPLDAAALVGTEDFRKSGGRVGAREEDLLAPGFHLRGEGELEARVVEEGENEVGGEGLVGRLCLGDVLLPGAVGLELVGGDRDDADAGDDGGGTAAFGEQGDFRIGEEALAAAEDPAEVESGFVGGGAAFAWTAFGDGFDLDGAGPLEEVVGLVVEFDGDEFAPGGQDGFEEVGDLDERLHRVDAAFWIVVEMGFARVGGEADEFGAFGGGGVGAAFAGVGLAEGREPVFAIGILPVGLEGEAGGLGLKDEDEGADGGGGRRGGGRLGGCGRGDGHTIGSRGFRGGLWNRDRFARKGGDFVGDELFDLVQAGDGECMGDLDIGRGGADVEGAALPFDDRVLVVFIDPAVDDGVVGGDLQLADFTVAVDAAAFL